VARHFRIYYDLPGIGPEDRRREKHGRSHKFSVYTEGTDGTWEAAPVHGVIAINVQNLTDPGNAWTIHWYSPNASEGRLKCPSCLWAPLGNEYYIKGPEDKDPHATSSLAPFLDKVGMAEAEAVAAGYVKYGRYVDQDKWEAIMDEACQDADYPRKPYRRRSTDYK
jgi:hypothetical protein